jgi:hypothetical protein
MNSFDSEQSPVVGSYVHGNEPLDSIIDGEFLIQVGDYQLINTRFLLHGLSH